MGSQGCIRAQSTRRGSTRRENDFSSLAHDGLTECRTPNRYDPSRHYRHFRVQIPSDPRDVRKTITPKAPLFKRGGRTDVVTPKASMPLTRALGATRIASPHISPRAAMIAQDFARVRVLGAFSRGARGAPFAKKQQREGHPSQKNSSARGTLRKKTAARGGTPRKKRDGSIAMPMVWRPCARTRAKVPHRRRLRLRLWPDPTVRGRGQRTLYSAALQKNRRT